MELDSDNKSDISKLSPVFSELYFELDLLEGKITSLIVFKTYVYSSKILDNLSI